MAMDLASIAAQVGWYYNVELLPGVVTRGLPLKNLHLNRPALSRVQLEGQVCLDIGSMEGVIPALMARGGAAEVVSYDRDPHKVRFEALEHAYAFKAERVIKPSIADLISGFLAEARPAFDVVTFFGVLYHMYDPFVALRQMRQLTRNGGLMLLETPSVLDESMASYFNAQGRLFGEASTYYMHSVPLLEYQLRYSGFEPLDVLYFRSKSCDVTGKQLIRVAVACRASEQPVTDPEDKWMSASRDTGPRARDEGLFPSLGHKGDKTEVGYRNDSHNLQYNKKTGGLDLLQSVLASDEVAMNPDNLTLFLEDTQ